MAKRTKIKTEWNLSLILPKADKKTVAKEIKRIEKATDTFVKKWKGRKDWLSKPAVLAKLLVDYERLSRRGGGGGAPGYYFHLAFNLDQNNPKLKARVDELSEFSIRQYNKLRFVDLELSKISGAQQKKFLRASELKNYKNYLTYLFNWAKYRLSEGEENVMALLSAPSHGHWTRMTSGFVSREEREALNKKGKKEKKNFSQLTGLLESPKKKIRDVAAGAINDIIEKNVDVAEAEMNAVLLSKKIRDDLRTFPRPDLPRHLDDQILSTTVDTLVEVVASNFKVPKKYYGLKARLLKQKQLEYYERSVSHGSISDAYSFEKGVEIIKKVFGDLDPYFKDVFNSYVEKGQIDVYPKKGKAGGAFCSGRLIDYPSFVFLNWNDTLYDVRVLAHEMGHALHNEYMKKSQSAFYYGASLATAEVASTFMEDFVTDHLLEKADDEKKLVLLIQKLENDIASIHRQVAAYSFEQELHKSFKERGYLSKEELGSLFKKHMSSYMGPSIRQTPGSEYWWVAWGHFRIFFYVYSYASGKLISKALQRRVKKDPTKIEEVKKFLSAGSSDTPENIFKSIGIDITKKSFWEEGLKEVEELYDEIEALAKKLKKI